MFKFISIMLLMLLITGCGAIEKNEYNLGHEEGYNIECSNLIKSHFNGLTKKHLKGYVNGRIERLIECQKTVNIIS